MLTIQQIKYFDTNAKTFHDTLHAIKFIFRSFFLAKSRKVICKILPEEKVRIWKIFNLPTFPPHPKSIVSYIVGMKEEDPLFFSHQTYGKLGQFTSESLLIQFGLWHDASFASVGPSFRLRKTPTPLIDSSVMLKRLVEMGCLNWRKKRWVKWITWGKLCYLKSWLKVNFM